MKLSEVVERELSDGRYIINPEVATARLRAFLDVVTGLKLEVAALESRCAELERALRAIADGIPYGGDNLKSDWSRNIAKAALANAAGYGAAIEAVKKLKEVRHGS